MTRSPGWSKTRRLSRSSLPEIYTVACSLSHHGGVVSKGHSGAAHHKDIGDDTSTDQALAQVGEGSLQVGSAEKNVIGLTHAASRSLADI